MNQLLFVDLVRNITDTEGDGPFVLGDAVRGFEDFKARVMVGDRFYYSCNGIDHPREREVGRGQLLHGGIISRGPINGTLTQFSRGSKSIALIAPAEAVSR
jgi:hypothetical protein